MVVFGSAERAAAPGRTLVQQTESSDGHLLEVLNNLTPGTYWHLWDKWLRS